MSSSSSQGLTRNPPSVYLLGGEGVKSVLGRQGQMQKGGKVRHPLAGGYKGGGKGQM